MDQELIELLKQGRKLEAIKKCQEVAGVSFSEAKTYIEEIELGIPAAEIGNLDSFLIGLLKDNRKLEVIKKYQDDKKVSFQEAKQYVEKLESKLHTGFKTDAVHVTATVNNDEKPKQKRTGWGSIFISVVVILIVLKGFSYYTNGGVGLGTATQYVFRMADKIIPWPYTENLNVYDEPGIDYGSPEEASAEDEVLSEDTETYVLEGEVISAKDGEFLEGVHVYQEDLGDSEIVSDEDGYFKIAVTRDVKLILVFESDEYKTKRIDVSDILDASDDDLISVTLEEKSFEDYVY